MYRVLKKKNDGSVEKIYSSNNYDKVLNRFVKETDKELEKEMSVEEWVEVAIVEDGRELPMLSYMVKGEKR